MLYPLADLKGVVIFHKIISLNQIFLILLLIKAENYIFNGESKLQDMILSFIKEQQKSNLVKNYLDKISV